MNVLKLIKLFLNRTKSNENYFAFQEYQAEEILKYCIKFLKLNKNNTVMDYGCGNGGWSRVMARYFNEVVSVDYYAENAFEKLKNYKNIIVEQGDLIDYKTDPKDFIFCTSVIEHIPSDKQNCFINSIYNNLNEKGVLLLSFPPFYTLRGGHWVSPFHFLPEKIALKLAKFFYKSDFPSYAKMSGNYGLHITTIKKVKKMLLDNGFKILKIKSRYMPDWYSKLFAQNEFLNWHVEFFCQKNT
jgi:cyclopropane fatty-acyl-phospholipid synthase-like methyltransferase